MSQDPGGFIGVDLNATGNIAVVVDPSTGKIWRFSGDIPDVRKKYSQLYSRSKRSKKKHRGGAYARFIRRENSRLKHKFNRISKSIVFIAKGLDRGIKLENLYKFEKYDKVLQQIVNRNWEFAELQVMIEKRAHRNGIDVLYVDPAYTSSRCCLCGGVGDRNRKIFRCSECGFTLNADVNAAYNISQRNGVSSNIFQTETKCELTEIDDALVSANLARMPSCNSDVVLI